MRAALAAVLAVSAPSLVGACSLLVETSDLSAASDASATSPAPIDPRAPEGGARVDGGGDGADGARDAAADAKPLPRGCPAGETAGLAFCDDFDRPDAPGLYSIGQGVNLGLSEDDPWSSPASLSISGPRNGGASRGVSIGRPSTVRLSFAVRLTRLEARVQLFGIITDRNAAFINVYPDGVSVAEGFNNSGQTSYRYHPKTPLSVNLSRWQHVVLELRGINGGAPTSTLTWDGAPIEVAVPLQPWPADETVALIGAPFAEDSFSIALDDIRVDVEP